MAADEAAAVRDLPAALPLSPEPLRLRLARLRARHRLLPVQQAVVVDVVVAADAGAVVVVGAAERAVAPQRSRQVRAYC